jgi:xanthine dehydrogenase accessory factor
MGDRSQGEATPAGATPLAVAADWLAQGREVALASVVSTWGSSPCPVGAHLVIAGDGAFHGSVSGGCIEGAVIEEARAVLAERAPRRVDYGVDDELAWSVGLSCGGRIEVLIERLDPGRAAWRDLVAAAAARTAVAAVVRLGDGARGVVGPATASGELELDPATLAELRRRLRGGASGLLEASGAALFVRSYLPAPRLLIVGAVHIAQLLAPLAALAGFAVTVVDPRSAFASAERFPGVALDPRWPDAALAAHGLDAGTALVALAHDPKLDDPALLAALASPAFYIGALGSRKTHARRVERLTAAGAGAALGRIHAPVGLDLGGRAPAEIAVAIVAEMIQTRYREAVA